MSEAEQFLTERVEQLLAEEDLANKSDPASDVDTNNEEDDASDDEPENPSEPRKPRRAEIDPETLTAEEREALRLRVIAQVEFYFGDSHYPKDQFMLDQADEEGFIDIKIVMAFKKMRRLTQFAGFVAESMKSSEVVGVNADGTRLKRKQPIPKNLEDALARTVLVERLPAGETEETILARFAPYGQVDQIRVLQKTDPYPSDINKYIMKGYRAKIPPGLHPSERPIALVEMSTLEQAYTAVRGIAIAGEWRAVGAYVTVLYHKAKPKKKGAPGEESRSTSQSPVPRSPPISIVLSKEGVARAHSFGGSRAHGSASPSPSASPLTGLRHFDAQGSSPLASTGKTPPIRLTLGLNRGASPSARDTNSPLGHRRIDSPVTTVNVLRPPKIPDGGPGFSRGRGQPLSQ